MKEQIELQVYNKHKLRIRTFLVEPYMKKPHYDEVFEKETSDLVGMDGLYYKLDFPNRSQKPTAFDGRRFKHLIEFDGRCITLATTDINEDGQYGTYSTSIPLSSVEYYAEHGGKGGASFFNGEEYLIFRIKDDLGKEYSLYIPKENRAIGQEAFDLYCDYKFLGKDMDILGSVHKGYSSVGDIPLKISTQTVLDNKSNISNTEIVKRMLFKDYEWDAIDGYCNLKVIKKFKDVYLVEERIVLKTMDILGIASGLSSNKHVQKFYNK